MGNFLVAIIAVGVAMILGSDEIRGVLKIIGMILIIGIFEWGEFVALRALNPDLFDKVIAVSLIAIGLKIIWRIRSK